MKIALLVSCDFWLDQKDEELTEGIATEDTDTTDSTCIPINTTEAGTASNCNCFTSIELADSGSVRLDPLILNRMDANQIG
jgi:hypothetical protein